MRAMVASVTRRLSMPGAGPAVLLLLLAVVNAGSAVSAKAEVPATPKLDDLPLKESVSQYGVTWTFDKPARVGRFVTGDWYVIGPVTVKMIDPKPLFDAEVTDVDDREKEVFNGKYCRNGSMLNPPPNPRRDLTPSKSGFDSRLRHDIYDPALAARLPIRMSPGDSLVSAVSKGPTLRGHHNAPVQTVAVLTCLKEPVPADAFRPGYMDRQSEIYLARNLRRDLLLRLPKARGIPDIAKVTAFYSGTHMEAGSPFYEDRSTRTYDLSGEPWEYSGYGQFCAEAAASAALLLHMDFSPEEKEPLLVNFTQYAIDLWGIVKSGHRGWPAWGGWGSGRKLPIVFAGILLGDEKMASPTRSYPGVQFQEDMQTVYDACWTGARVVFGGQVGPAGMSDEFGWGLMEHQPPSRWCNTIHEKYRRANTSKPWVGEALVMRLMQAEPQWNHNAFFDYVDRWMAEEATPAVMNGLVTALAPARTVERNPSPDWLEQAAGTRAITRATPKFVEGLWAAYRDKLPDFGGKASPPRPATAWQAKPDLKSVAVEIGSNREFRVAGKPFLPLMVYAEHPKRIADVLAIGANTVAEGSFEYLPGNQHVSNKDFLDQLAAKGLYGVIGEDARVIGHPNLLGWIHADQPDAPLVAKRANLTLEGCVSAKHNFGAKENLFDGDTTGWPAKFTPFVGASVTLTRQTPITIHGLAVWLPLNVRESTPKEMVVLADGKQILRITLKEAKGEQRFPLAQPVTCKTLTLQGVSLYPPSDKLKDPAKATTAYFTEVAGLDAQGGMVPLYEPTTEPFGTPPQAEFTYRWCKQMDQSRPVFVTFSPSFMNELKDYDDAAKKEVYGGFLRNCEVAGCLVAPISQWNAPTRLDWVASGVGQLRTLAGPTKPVIAWIETRVLSKKETAASSGREAADDSEPLTAPAPTPVPAPVQPAASVPSTIPVTPAYVRAEAWMAIIQGATALGYRGFEGYGDERPGQEVMVELKRLNAQLTRLAAAILASPAEGKITMALEGKLAGHFKATQHEGATYIFAQNIDLGPDAGQQEPGQAITPRAANAVITVAGLKKGAQVEVVDENRTIAADEGSFADHFAPLAEHVYKLPTP